MSNTDARFTRTLPQGGKPFGVGKTRRSGDGTRPLLLAAVLFAGDLVSGAIAVVLAALIVTALAGEVGHTGRIYAEAGLLLLLLLGVSCALGLYRSNIRHPLERFRLRVTATLLFVFAGMLMWLRTGSLPELAIVPVAGVIATVIGVWTEHLVRALLARSGAYSTTVAILGTGADSQALARQLLDRPGCGFRPRGFIEDGAGTGSAVDADDTDAALPVLGTLDQWNGGSAAEVVIVPDCDSIPRDPAALYRLGARQVLVVTRFGELPSFGVQVRNAGCFVAMELNGRQGDYSKGLKRAVDVILALALLALAAPIIGLLALAIKLVDPGTAFYGQWRVGQRGRPIRVIKLRTMYRDAEQRLETVLANSPDLREQWQRHFKLVRDPRILPYVGSLIRRASLDELPQLWNVICGDMSLVGPRPFPAYHLEAFDPEFRALRSSVPPGLTGFWQISSRSNGDLDVQRAEDSFYINNRSLWLDLYILIATLPAVMGATGAR
jgi:lipopolysaccharide/colanic/teichoic acid biosynthesis glycosyltransferase